MSVQSVTITMPIAGITELVITNVGTRGPIGPTGPAGTTTWAGITDKPSTFPPIIGNGAADAVAGNDSRLSNARTPTAHKSSHITGPDALTPADIGAAPEYPRAIAVTGTLTDGTDSVVFSTLVFVELNIAGLLVWTDTGNSLGEDVNYQCAGEPGLWSAQKTGSAEWTSTAPVSSPDLVSKIYPGAWHADNNPHGWRPSTPSTGTPVVTSADITTAESVEAAGAAMAADLGTAAAADVGDFAAASHTHVTADITDATSEPTEGKVVKYTSEYEGVPYLKADGLFLSDFEITPPEDGQSGGAALPNGCSYPKRFAVTSNTDGQVQYSEIGGTKPSYTASEVSAARAIETKTTDFTAVVGGRYIVESAGKISITDPAGTTAGESYEVWIGSGTIWFNGAGTVYSASRFSIRRRYTGSAWATPSPVVTDALQVGATNTWDGSTFTGAQSFSGNVRMSAQAGTDPTDALSIALSQRIAMPRRIIAHGVGSASGTGATSRRAIAAGMFDGDLSTGSGSGAYYKVQLLNTGVGSLYTIASASAVHLGQPWGFMFRVNGKYPPSANTHIMFSIGADVASGVPSTGVNVGIEVTSATSARLWVCNNGSASYSSAGTIAWEAGYDLFFWLDNNGSGTLSLYYARKTDAGALPLKPTSAICTLAGIPNAASTASDVQAMLRATGTPGAFTALLLRDAVYYEY